MIRSRPEGETFLHLCGSRSIGRLLIELSAVLTIKVGGPGPGPAQQRARPPDRCGRRGIEAPRVSTSRAIVHSRICD
jgi:hypothetical protein